MCKHKDYVFVFADLCVPRAGCEARTRSHRQAGCVYIFYTANHYADKYIEMRSK